MFYFVSRTFCHKEYGTPNFGLILKKTPFSQSRQLYTVRPRWGGGRTKFKPACVGWPMKIIVLLFGFKPAGVGWPKIKRSLLFWKFSRITKS